MVEQLTHQSKVGGSSPAAHQALGERDNDKEVLKNLQDYNSLKSGYLHLTGQPYCKKSRPAKVKDGIKNLILRNYLVDRYA